LPEHSTDPPVSLKTGGKCLKRLSPHCRGKSMRSMPKRWLCTMFSLEVQATARRRSGVLEDIGVPAVEVGFEPGKPVPLRFVCLQVVEPYRRVLTLSYIWCQRVLLRCLTMFARAARVGADERKKQVHDMRQKARCIPYPANVIPRVARPGARSPSAPRTSAGGSASLRRRVPDKVGPSHR
jgi:hypothetical protein